MIENKTDQRQRAEFERRGRDLDQERDAKRQSEIDQEKRDLDARAATLTRAMAHSSAADHAAGVTIALAMITVFVMSLLEFC